MLGILHQVIDFLYPPSCYVCHEPLLSQGFFQEILCCKCFEALRFSTTPSCNLCANPLDFINTPCPRPHESYAFDASRFGLIYDQNGPLKKLLMDLKYGGKADLCPLLARLTLHGLDPLDSFFANVDVITCVPLHPYRLLTRGYNQASLLAFSFFSVLKKTHPLIIFHPTLLKRQRLTPPQDKRNLQRFHNVKDAFKCIEPTQVASKTILLVDDVETSSATLHFCAKPLKEAGAKSVQTLCVARVIHE